MSIPDPNLPAPTSKDDCDALFRIAGLECLKPAMTFMEENATSHKVRWYIAHWLLERAGYMIEELMGVPDGTYGAGGGGPKPW